MECDLCGKLPSSKVRFHCATCARNVLLPLRLEHLGTLSDKEAMARRVEAVVLTTGSKIPRESLSVSGKIIDTHDCAKAWEMDKMLSESTALKERVQVMDEQAKALRSEMERYKKTIDSQRAAILQRRSDAESATYGLQDREAKEVDSLEASIRRTKRRWEVKHAEIVEGRAALCKPAARLAGLRRHRRPREDGSMREYYTISSGLNIYDLREIHTAKPEELTASLTSLANLTARVANYLALRLPAEITLPHKDYPLPTIFTPQSSYLGREVTFPGSTPNVSSPNSPVASRSLDVQSTPTPRPLFIRTLLSKLAKDDSKTYAMFVEGVTLLAWDIAWLCRTQGMKGVDSETDMCNMGRNLWNLLLADPVIVSTPAKQEEATTDPGTLLARKPQVENPPSWFGHYSHGTAHSFLGTADSKTIMQDWKLKNPMRAVSKIRDALNNEMQRAEWEVLQEAEWEGH